MSSDEIPVIDVFLTRDNIEEVVKMVVGWTKPEWTCMGIKHQILPKGFLNIVVICYPVRPDSTPNSTPDYSDILIVKTSTHLFAGPIEETRETGRFLHKHHYDGPGIVAFLRNGLCIQHTNGTVLDWNHPTLYEAYAFKLVADEMARWHQRKALKKAQDEGLRRIHVLWGHGLTKWTECLESDAMKEHKHLYPSKEEIMAEEAEVRQYLLDHDELEISLVHGDINGSNIAISDDCKSIQMIDFDFTGISFSQLDIAYFMMAFVNLADSPSFETLPSKDYEIKFLTQYLKRRKELDSDDAKIQAKTVDKLFREVQKAKLFILLRYTMSGPTLTYCSNVGTLFLKFSRQVWCRYKEVKNRVLESDGSVNLIY